MPYPVDTAVLSFTLRFPPAPEHVWEVIDGQRQRTEAPRLDRNGLPLHSYACHVTGAGRDDQVRVKVAGIPPVEAVAGATVRFVGLVLGVTNGYTWLRAEAVEVVESASVWAS